MGTASLFRLPLSTLLTGTSTVKRQPLQCLLWTFLLILYIHYITRLPPVDLTPPKPPPLDDIPPTIWQISFNQTPLPPTPSLHSWITQNQDYPYTLVSSPGANAHALKHYPHRRHILAPFLSLRDPILRAHLLRYMLLDSAGGTYADLDITARRPIRDWVPRRLKRKIRAVVGVEADPGLEDSPRLQLSQRTMAASRGHPLMARVVADTVDAIQTLAVETGTTVAELRPRDEELARITGPGIWTRAVLETLSEAAGAEVSWRNLTGMTKARAFGDVLVLPVDGFGTVREGGGDAVVRHGWSG